MHYPQELSSLRPPRTFLEDKTNFFHLHNRSLESRKIHAIQDAARAHDYSFLSTQRSLMEEEFRHLYQVLNTEKTHTDKDLWLYCYYCSIMLSEYYKANQYNSPRKYQEYLSLAETIEHYYTKGKLSKSKLRTWQAHLKADVADLLSTPFHLSKLRAWVGFINGYRIAFTFSRLTNQSFFQAIADWRLFLRNNLHFSFDLDEINRNINAPTAMFRALSVGLFFTRLLINLSLVIKHTFFPTHGEKNIAMTTRFLQEIKERYPQLLNDAVWSTINALTNYASFFKISNPVATGLLMAGLSFDFGLLTYRLMRSENEYRVKMSEYQEEIRLIHAQIKQLHQNKNASSALLQNRLIYIDAQLKEQHLQMHVLRTNFCANLMAALLVLSGFSLSVIAGAPAALGACYLLIVIGTALYITADLYSQYREKSLRATQLSSKNQSAQEIHQAKQEVAIAQNNFTTAMLKNTVVPLIIMGTLAFSWQAALVLLVLFVASEYATKYQKTDRAYRAGTLFSKSEVKPFNPTKEQDQPAQHPRRNTQPA